MFPSKNSVDYISEMNRLFPNTSENDILRHPFNQALLSPLNHSIMGQSSSSADSTSPESYKEVSSPMKPFGFQDSPPFMQGTNNLHVRRQRPIVGRKIFSHHDPMMHETQPPKSPSMETDLASNWSDIPNIPNIFIESNNYTHNAFYELFPVERTDVKFKTPVKTSMSNLSDTSSFSPNMTNDSSFSNLSNINTPTYPSPPLAMSPMYPTSPLPASPFQMSPMSSMSHYKMSPKKQGSLEMAVCEYKKYYNKSPSSQDSYHYEIDVQKMCTFCRKNGETPVVYMTHNVKENDGNKYMVTCPILRSHVCSMCGATGDNAHTITYCPIVRRSNHGRPVPSTTITLKNTRIKSNGRRRF